MYKRELRGLLIFLSLLTIILIVTVCLRNCGKSSPSEAGIMFIPDTTTVAPTSKETQAKNDNSKKEKSKKSKTKKPKTTQSRKPTSPFDDPTPSIQ